MTPKTIKDQVSAAIAKADHGKRNGTLHPDDHTALKKMQADLNRRRQSLKHRLNA